MKNYKNYKNKTKTTNIFTWLFIEAIFTFVVATVSIALYDMYINIEVNPNDNYTAEKVNKEIQIQDTNDISETLEDVSKSIVRNIKNNI